MRYTWETDDIKPGVKADTPGRSEVWMVAYEVSGADGRLAVVSMSDGLIAHRELTRSQIAEMWNTMGRAPVHQ